jgi:3-oxoacyl-(acyl-carrier-protein) synthase
MREPIPTSPPADVIITGCGAITAVGHGVEALRSAMRANTSGLRPNARFAQPRYQSSITAAIPRNGSLTEEDDPAFRLATDALQEARANARESLASIPAERIGLVLSRALNDQGQH